MKARKIYSNPISWFVFLSVLFILLNVLTFDWKLAWNDETELTDTSANYVEFGQWVSKAFPDYGGKEPFSVYVPLHQMLLALWMKFFGFSMVSARSFNLLLTLLSGCGLIGFAKRLIGRTPGKYTVISFTFLFCGCAEFASIYRNGRGDILGVLLCILLSNVVYDYIHCKDKNLLYAIGVLSGLLICSALQSCIFAVAALLLVYIVYEEYRANLRQIAKYMFLGYIVGFVLMLLFFWHNDHLFPFLVSIASLSGTLKSFAAFLLPYFGPMFGLNPEEWLAKLADDEKGPSLFIKMMSIYSFVTYDILLVVSVLILIIQGQFKNRQTWRSPLVFLLMFVVLVPVFMNLAGRYVDYYRWMSYLPLVLVVVFLCEQVENKPIKIGMVIMSMLISCVGALSLFDQDQKKKNDAIKELCQNLPIKKSDIVCAPDEFFYEIRKKSNNCYFTKHYPVKYMDINKINYYIKDLKDFETMHNTKFSRQLQKTFDENNSIRLHPIDSCMLLRVVVYQVEHIEINNNIQ